MSDRTPDTSGATHRYEVVQAATAATQVLSVARSADDSAAWGEHHVSIRGKHLAALVAAAKEAGYEPRPLI